MVIIADMKIPKNCQECPFSHLVFGFASCIAQSQYKSPDNGGTFKTTILRDGNDQQRDSSCPLYDDTAINILIEEIKRLKSRSDTKGE